MNITHLPSAKPCLYKQTNNDDTILTGTLLQGQTHPCQLCSGLVHKGSWSAGQYRRLGSLAHKIERQQMKQNWLGHHRLCWPGSSFHGKIPTCKPKQDTNLQYVACSRLRMGKKVHLGLSLLILSTSSNNSFSIRVLEGSCRFILSWSWVFRNRTGILFNHCFMVWKTLDGSGLLCHGSTKRLKIRQVINTTLEGGIDLVFPWEDIWTRAIQDRVE